MRKGVHYLLKAYKSAALKNATLIFARAVDPAFRPVLQKFDGLFNAVGRIPHLQVQRYYQKADLFVIPSLADAYPLVAMEAMSAGLPVIVSENTGTAGIIADGENGFVVPICDHQILAEKISFLYNNRERCIAMGKNASSTAKRFNWSNYERICEEFYTHTLFAN